MKKLLIALTAAVGIASFAKAEGYSELQEGFEGSFAQYKWVKPAGDCSEFTAWTDAQPTFEKFPGDFLEFGDYYLGVSNADPLLAAFGSIAEQGGDDVPQPVAIGDGLYVDTYVKFTATETAPTVSNGVDKLIVWMYGSDAEVENPPTNLIVTAGFCENNGVAPCNYVVDKKIEPDSWHRLTIRTKVVGTGVTAFRVYIDGQEVTITGKLASDGTISETDQSVGDSGYIASVTEATAAQKLASYQLFPSMVITGDNITKLSCVGLEGWGAVDDFVLTNVDPFEDKFDNVEFTVKWDPEKFTSISYKLGDDESVEVEDLTEGSLTLSSKLAPLAEVTITGTPVDGYMVSAKAEGDCSVSETTFTMKAKADLASGKATGTLEAKEIVAKIGETPYASIQDAVAAIETSGTIVLQKGCTVVNDGSTTEQEDPLWGVVIEDGQEVTLDLNGQTIEVVKGDTGNDDQPFISNYGSLTIVDSDAPNGEITTEAASPLVVNLGTLAIQAGKFTGMVIPDVEGVGEATITGGSFLSDGETAFYLAGCVPETGYTTSLADNYWTVTSGEGPTTFTVTVAAPETGISLSSIVTNEVAVAEPTADDYTVPAGTTVVVTYALAEGYELAEDSAELIQTFDSIAKDESTTAPTATPKTFYVQTYTNGVEAVQVQYTYGDAKITLTAPTFDTETEEWDGKWYTTADGTIEFVFDGTVAEDTQVAYAKITAKQVTPAFPSVDEGDPITTPADFIAAAKSGTTIKLPTDWTIDGTAIKNANGEVWATLPSYYNISDGGAVSLNEAVVKPMVNNGTTNPGIVVGAKAAINVTNPKVGLFYVLKRATTVNGPYEPVAYDTTDTDDEDIQLTDPTDVGAAAFYKVEVTDVEPVLN